LELKIIGGTSTEHYIKDTKKLPSGPRKEYPKKYFQKDAYNNLLR